MTPYRLEVANRSHGSKSFPNSYPPATTILTLHFLTRKKRSIIQDNGFELAQGEHLMEFDIFISKLLADENQ
jgi:hypothetical protein